MKDMDPTPLTPDFDIWPQDRTPLAVSVSEGALVVEWDDARTSRYHPLLLAENDPAEDCLHPKSRETVLSPLDLPEELVVVDAQIEADAIRVHWSHGRRSSRFHTGWLYGNGWFGSPATEPKPVLWTGRELSEPPTFDGARALRDPSVFLDWLCALRDYGVARLEALPNEDGLLERIVTRIGVIRASNFGPMYTLAIKDDPDSNAFTSEALLQHIDMPTRECPHGLQFLFCRENTTQGGAGIYVDGYRVAEDLRREEPGHFAALCEVPWTYNNRSRTSSYKATGPVVELDTNGAVAGIRYTPWLRAPLVAGLEDQDRAYRSFRAFAARSQDPDYQMKITYRAGDLLAFDNRRALHGRDRYDARGGTRFIEGIYADRDDLYSAIRTTQRDIQKGEVE